MNDYYINGLRVIYSKFLGPGDVRIMKHWILMGEGTDVDDVIFKMNLTDLDRRFLAALHIEEP